MTHKKSIRYRAIFFLFISALLATLIFCSTKSSSTGLPVSASPDTLRYQLVWSDEFNGTSVDTTAWSFDTGNSGWGNNELENYQPGNATVANDNLVITAKKETAGTAQYTSARMKTENKKSFTYGRIEARIKLPVGQGLWPAFWTLGSNISTVGWPQCGEIDIMERINTDSLLYGTMHWNNNGHVSNGGKTTSSPSEYHVYDVEWNATSITWHIDGVQYFKTDIAGNVNNTGAFHAPFFIILNLAVGGNWPGSTVDDTKFPARMYVDYVRVYQLK